MGRFGPKGQIQKCECDVRKWEQRTGNSHPTTVHTPSHFLPIKNNNNSYILYEFL